jgi:hypothetical protein
MPRAGMIFSRIDEGWEKSLYDSLSSMPRLSFAGLKAIIVHRHHIASPASIVEFSRAWVSKEIRRTAESPEDAEAYETFGFQELTPQKSRFSFGIVHSQQGKPGSIYVAINVYRWRDTYLAPEMWAT